MNQRRLCSLWALVSSYYTRGGKGGGCVFGEGAKTSAGKWGALPPLECVGEGEGACVT
jgi:hypothetical protein